MRDSKKGCWFAFGILLLLFVCLHIPVWVDDAGALKNRAQVYDLVSTGDNLFEAEQILRKAGFKLLHEKPIKPTYDKSYFQQLVAIGNTSPNAF